MLNREQATFLLEIIETPGVVFAVKKCRLVADCCDELEKIAMRVPANGTGPQPDDRRELIREP